MTSFLSSIDNYQLSSKLGSGATSEVYHSTYVDSNGVSKDIAIKILKKPSKSIETEANLLSQISHQNVLQLFKIGKGTFIKQGNCIGEFPYIIIEYAEKGELFNYVFFPKKGFGEEHGRLLFKQIINGLHGCHNAGIAHRDLKMENIMFDKNYNIKLADFGFASLIQGKNNDGQLTTPIGTMAYAAPEILMRRPYDGIKSDIFSLGVVLFVMVTCKMGFVKAARDDRYYSCIIHKKYDKYWNLLSKIGITNQISNEFKDLYLKMIAFNPNERPTIQDIMDHPWMKGNDMNEKESEMKLLMELQEREIAIKEEQELQMIVDEDVNDKNQNNINYKGISADSGYEEYFNDKMKCVKNDRYCLFRRNGIMFVFKGKMNPVLLMNKIAFVIEDRTKGIKVIEPSNKRLQMKVIYENEDGECEEEEHRKGNENEMEVIEKEQLIIRIKLICVKENEEYVLVFYKKGGDRFEYYEKINEIKKVIREVV